jgi:hypothetical protein
VGDPIIPLFLFIFVLERLEGGLKASPALKQANRLALLILFWLCKGAGFA